MTDTAPVDAAPPSGLGQAWRTDLFIPAYRPIQSADWRLEIVPMSISRGYWNGPSPVMGMAALVRRGAGGWTDTWMSMTPMEIESQEIGVRAARGHVVVMGLGMGWAALNAALMPDVTAVTVVEFDPAVIAMNRDLDTLAQIPAESASKITILQGDAYGFVPDRAADTLMADIWQPLYGRGRVEEVRRMAANTRAATVYYFGQEIEIAMYARDAGLPLDEAGIARIAADMALPLIGPGQPDYPDRVARAAAQWWRGD